MYFCCIAIVLRCNCPREGTRICEPLRFSNNKHNLRNQFLYIADDADGGEIVAEDVFAL